MGTSDGPPVSAPGTFGVRILGVSEVSKAIKGAIREDPRLADLWVEGEIGRVTVSSAGHAYFTLKDERNQLQCVWFRDDRLRSVFEARAGLRVVAHGRIDLFEPQGALAALRRVAPAGRGRGPGPALRGAQGQAGGRGPVRAGAQAAAADPADRPSRSSPARPVPSGRTSPRSSPGAGPWPGSSSSRPRSRAMRHRRASSRPSGAWSAIARS